jgi:hypothetical protein
MAESTVISIKMFDGTDYRSWSLEVEILLEQKQVLGIVDGTEKAPNAKNAKDATEFKAWKKQHGIARLTISPRNVEVIAAAVWRSERCESALGSAEGGLQIEGGAECLGFARRNVSCEVEGL